MSKQTGDKPSRVIHLTTLEKGGGTEHFVEALCDAVPEFEWISLQGLGAWPFSLKSASILKSKLGNTDNTVVYAYGLNAQLAAWKVFPASVPIIGVIHGEIDFQGIKDSIRKQYEKRICWWVGNTEAVLDRRNGSVIYNGILTLDQMHLIPADTPRKYDFGVLANGGEVKGHRFLIQLWKERKKSGKPPFGSLAFAGNLPDQLREDAEAAGIFCPGYCDRVEFLSDLRLLLVPSVSESFPTVIAESMSLGIPVLANPAGGIAEVLTPISPESIAHRATWSSIFDKPEFEWRESKARDASGQIRELFDFRRSCVAFVQQASRVFTKYRQSGKR